MLNPRGRPSSNLKTHPDIDLEEEREALLEDQKVIRQRARKLSVETNRRRKALAEKQREEEEREQKFREDVLQQRKLKLQEATEKFQRAHLPPSQRRRPVYNVRKRPTLKLEDALDQIRGSSPSTYYYLSNYRSPNNDRATDTASSFSSIGHSTWPRKQPPPTTGDLERFFQDRPSVLVDSDQLYFQHKLEEAQRLLEEQHLSNLQSFHREVEQLAREDSLSSLDSLEENLEAVKEENSSIFSSDHFHKAFTEISSSVNRGYPNTDGGVHNLHYQPNLHEPSQSLPEEMTVEKRIPMGDQESLPQNGFQQKTMDTLTRNGNTHPVNTYNASMSNQDLNHVSRVSLTENKLYYYDKDNTTCNVVVRPSKAWATPDPTPRQTNQTSTAHNNKDTPQHLGLSTKPTMTQPLATPVVVSFPESSAGSCQYNVSTDLKLSKHSNKIHSMSSVPDAEMLTNIYNTQFHTMKNGHSKPVEINSQESPSNQKRSSPTQSSNTDSKVIQNQKADQNGATFSLDHPDLPLSTVYRKSRINSAGKEGKKLLKSILKKGSKYENAYTRAMGISKMVLMGDRGSAGIRDSVELLKEKEHKKTNNKKLRWLDEIEKIMEDQDVRGMTETMKAIKKPSVESPLMAHWKENDLTLTTSPNGPAAGTPSSVFSTGYHFTKQAWMMTNDEESNSAGHIHPVRSPPKAKTKVVRRPKSARTPSVVHRNRKGIIIRPQSATEASKIARSQGKIISPHPPPRSATDNNRELATKAKTLPVNSSISQVNTLNKVVSSSNHSISRDNRAYQTMPHSSGNTLTTQAYTPSATDHAAKAALTSNSERVLALQESLHVPIKRQPVFSENGLRLDHTPTDEEIALLWHGVRSALTHKNAATGDFRVGDLPSNMRPNLSHIVIDGATLSNWKSLSRMNGFFSPLNNGYVTLARRKQIVDSGENKRRLLLEQRKGRPASAGWGPAHVQNAMKTSPLPSAQEPGQSHGAAHCGDVSESTAQFMLAENLVETSATDGEILAAMQEAQAGKHKAPQTALSIEEQRLLQSLDRLNQRLYNVQEMKPSAATNGLQSKSPLKVHQFPPQPAEHMTQAQKYRSLSADPRTRLQRRY